MPVRSSPRTGTARRFARKTLVNALSVLSSPHHPDRYLEMVDALLVTSVDRARITHVDRSATDSTTLTVRPARPVHVEAGQHVTVAVRVDGVRHTRCYSPSIVDGKLVFTIGRHPGGVVSTHLHDHARIGDVLELGDAAGEFVLPSPRPRRLLFVAAGSGITPVLSMMRALADEKYDGCATLVYYARTPAHVPRRAELDALDALPGIDVVYAYTRSDAGSLQGRVEREHLATVAPWFAAAPTYVCGPDGFVERVRAICAEAEAGGVFHSERFTPPVFAVPSDEVTGTVAFTASGISADNTGSTLLDQAEAAGLTPEHGCRMGICHTCTAVRSSGCTRDVRTGEVDSEPGRRIQICVNLPVGDVSVDL